MPLRDRSQTTSHVFFTRSFSEYFFACTSSLMNTTFGCVSSATSRVSCPDFSSPIKRTMWYDDCADATSAARLPTRNEYSFVTESKPMPSSSGLPFAFWFAISMRFEALSTFVATLFSAKYSARCSAESWKPEPPMTTRPVRPSFAHVSATALYSICDSVCAPVPMQPSPPSLIR